MITPKNPIRTWEHLTLRDFQALDLSRTVVLVTCSPLEVHGPHLPVAADIVQGDAILEAATRRVAEERPGWTFIRLPHLMTAADVLPMRGSITFSPGTVESVLTDLGRSLAVDGFRHLWVGGFHGGPRHFLAKEKAAHTCWKQHGFGMISAFSLLIRELAPDYDLSDALAAALELPKVALEGDNHAGLIETSLMLYLQGAWVDPCFSSLARETADAYVEAKYSRPSKPNSLAQTLQNFGALHEYFYERSYSGAPALATPELGEKILDTLAQKAAPFLLELLDGRRTPDQCHSHLWKHRWLFLNSLTQAYDQLLHRRSRKLRARGLRRVQPGPG